MGMDYLLELAKTITPAIASLIIVIAVTIQFFSIVYSRHMRMRERELIMRMRERDEYLSTFRHEFSKQAKPIVENITINKNEAIEAKRRNFLNIPNISFHYVDKERVTNFYKDYFQEPTIEKMISEITDELTGDIKGKIPQLIETKVGGKDINKWISTIKLPDTSINGMFRRYQRETIKNQQVMIGLEEVDVELTELAQFHKMVSELQAKFDVNIDPKVISDKEATIKEKAAEKTIINLEKATGDILIEGNFKIVYANEGGDYYKCIYRHPVSDYILQSHKTVTISLLLPKEKLEPQVAGNYIQSLQSYIPLRVYGTVWQPISRKDNNWELTIIPLAVY